MPPTIRAATTADIVAICQIEYSAVSRFRTIPALAYHADGEVPKPERVEEWLRIGRVWVAENDGKVFGFITAYHKDAVIYIAEISVSMEAQGKGVGGILMNAVFAWAREDAASKASVTQSEARPRVSLTTYMDVPWNGQWYAKFGFREVEPEMLGPEHVEKMRFDVEERDLVREGWRRGVMVWEG